MNITHFYHYYEKSIGPFVNLSELDIADAERIQERIRQENTIFAAKRDRHYLLRRRELERIAYDYLIVTGGHPKSSFPHYMVVGECPWLESWYKEPAYIIIPIEQFDEDELTFSYGDLFPTFSERITDHKEYRKRIYRYHEILEIIHKYGLPQHWNRNGEFGPERYVEVHIWKDMSP